MAQTLACESNSGQESSVNNSIDSQVTLTVPSLFTGFLV